MPFPPGPPPAPRAYLIRPQLQQQGVTPLMLRLQTSIECALQARAAGEDSATMVSSLRTVTRGERRGRCLARSGVLPGRLAGCVAGATPRLRGLRGHAGRGCGAVTITSITMSTSDDAFTVQKHHRRGVPVPVPAPVPAGVDLVFGSPAALNAAFGRHASLGLDVASLDRVMTNVTQLAAVR